MFSDVWRLATNGVLRDLFAEGDRLSAGRVRRVGANCSLNNQEKSLAD
jgi:hypothetical protein